jgi:hypothetical protein
MVVILNLKDPKSGCHAQPRMHQSSSDSGREFFPRSRSSRREENQTKDDTQSGLF